MIGSAGAGKSVVNLFRHIRNINKGKNSAIICFNNTLQKYLFSATKEVNTDAAMRIHTLWGFARDGFIGQNGTWLYKNSWGGDCRGRQKYCKNGQKLDEIIVDEAQDVENKAFEVLRDTIGQKPVEKVEVNNSELVKQGLNKINEYFTDNKG